MESRERWSEEIRDGDPWLDHVHCQHESADPQDHLRPATLFRRNLLEFRAYCSRLVLLLRESKWSTFDHSMLAERLRYSVLMTLTSFVTFWMSLIFVILGGSVLILIFLTTVTVNCGHRMRKFVRNIRTRFVASRADQGAAFARHRTTSTSGETPDSNY